MSKKSFFIRVNNGKIDQKKGTSEFLNFVNESTTQEQQEIREAIESPAEHGFNTDVADTVFDMFDQLEGKEYVYVESEPEPIVEGAEDLFQYKVPEGQEDTLEPISEDTLNTYIDHIRADTTVPQKSYELQIPESDPMNQYVEQIRVVKGGLDVELKEQDLQNTPASMADLQTHTAKMMQNIQMSLSSLGGGGLGEPDVVRIVQQYSATLDSSDLDYIKDQLSVLDSATVISWIDSAIAEEHQFNVIEHASIIAYVDKEVSDEHDFNVQEHSKLDSAIADLASQIADGYTSDDFDSDFGHRTTDDLSEGKNNLYFTKQRTQAVIDSSRDSAWFTDQLSHNNLDGLKDVHYDSLQSDQILVWNGSVWHNEDQNLPAPLLTYHGDIDCTTDPAPANPANGDAYLNTGTGTALPSWVGLDSVEADNYVIYDSDDGDWDTFSFGGGGVSAVREGFGINVVGTPSMPTVEVDSDDLRVFLADKDENDSDHQQLRDDLVNITGDTMTGSLTIDVFDDSERADLTLSGYPTVRGTNHTQSGRINFLRDSGSTEPEIVPGDAYMSLSRINNEDWIAVKAPRGMFLFGELAMNSNIISGLNQLPTRDNNATNKKYVDNQDSDLRVDLLAALDSDANDRVKKSGDEMTGPLVITDDNSGLTVKSVTDGSVFESGKITMEGYRSGTGGAAASLRFSNAYDANCNASLEWFGTNATNGYFKFDDKVVIGKGQQLNATGFTLKGTTNSGQNGDLLTVYHNSTGLDAVNYYGKIDGDTNIVNKKYVDSAIAANSGGSSATAVDVQMDNAKFVVSSGGLGGTALIQNTVPSSAGQVRVLGWAEDANGGNGNTVALSGGVGTFRSPFWHPQIRKLEDGTIIGGWHTIQIYIPPTAGADGIGQDTLLLDQSRSWPPPELLVRTNSNALCAKFYVIDVFRQQSNAYAFVLQQQDFLGQRQLQIQETSHFGPDGLMDMLVGQSLANLPFKIDFKGLFSS